ncbi:Flagellar assembly factor FliW [compost metagenome]
MTSDQAQQESAIQLETPIYVFPKGLPGFDQLKDFSLEEHNDVFSLLSAVEQPAVSFITINPFDFIPDYEFVLPDDTISELKIGNREQVAVRCIVTWHSERTKISVNLLAPIIFNIQHLMGKQIVLQNSAYTTKHPLWTETTTGDEGGDS